MASTVYDKMQGKDVSLNKWAHELISAVVNTIPFK